MHIVLRLIKQKAICGVSAAVSLTDIYGYSDELCNTANDHCNIV